MPREDASFVSWKESCDTRGTFDIISLCTSTLAICVWSSLHTDIPLHPTLYNVYVKRVGWLLVGLFMPEMLVLSAFGQFICARWVVAQSRKYRPAQPGLRVTETWWTRVIPYFARRRAVGSTHEDHAMLGGGTPDTAAGTSSVPSSGVARWTLKHGFYAVMGGFVIETAPGEPFLPFPTSRVVLMRRGLLYLMQHAPELIPDVSEDDIEDRSKAGTLSKALLCLQVAVFCLNCVARWNQHMPLSLFEITTLAHALCALTVYALWWHKPFDIRQPTVISGERAREICALLMMCGVQEHPWILATGCQTLPAEHQYLHISSCTTSQRASDLERASRSVDGSVEFTATTGFLGFKPKKRPARAPAITRTTHHESPYHTACTPWFWYWHDNAEVALSSRDVTRLTLVERAISRFALPPSSGRLMFLAPEQQLRRGRAGASPRERTLVAVILAVVYGLPHLVAVRGYDFPTPLEGLLWRLSSYGLTFCPIVWFGWYYAQGLWERRFTARIGKGIRSLAFIIVPLYVMSTAFIVLESLRQIFALPEGAFSQPSPIRYLPHF
ncbi:hypothetical protein EXIGLDRAFT_719474 [Exidia glandulosa HHB12029]|uniref:Uncharacterized protein n=1 Tax=Exidia glandulosa HHB12029 TaxID=1314781 RepID=A0A165NQL3_EXIGL|nr:hypothetical protein EXIGLDRAFT_719474 [Exidia glandulosa HHB12029]